MIEVELIPVLKDNYAHLLKADNGETGIVDPGEAGPIIDVLEEQGLKLDYILNTHHHADHIAGNEELKDRYSAQLIGPGKESRIQHMDIMLYEGDRFSFGGEDVEVLETPGHTTGHICFYFPESKLAFTGDTLFSMGCGRLFEGTAEQMWNSLQKIMALPNETKVFCGHEYTLGSGEFCLTIEPENNDLKARVEDVRALRAENKPSLPSTVELEKRTNAFIRAGSPEKFAEIRRLKDAS